MAGDPKISYNSLLFEVKKLCWSLGLTNPNEKTWVSLATIILMTKVDRSVWEKAMYNGKALRVVQDLKCKIRPCRTMAKCDHWGRIVLFPASPDELKLEHPDIFQMAYPDIANIPSNAPTDCPLDALVLAQLRSMMPVRTSRYLTKDAKAGLQILPCWPPLPPDGSSVIPIRIGASLTRSHLVDPGCNSDGGGHHQDQAEEPLLPGSLFTYKDQTFFFCFKYQQRVHGMPYYHALSHRFKTTYIYIYI